jgi:serine/threonine protein kinase
MGRDIALKVFDPVALSHPEIVDGLKASESSTNALPSTMVLHVLESGTDPGTGAPFMVTDFSPHPSLEYLLGLCPLAPSDAITVVRKLAHTLDAAHALGTMHLGLKPSNVFVGPAPACDTRIGDFGVVIVRSTLRVGRDPAPIDFPWMAPEQAEPGSTVGPGADVFSLALVAFFALTGRSYWRSCQGTERDITEWKREITGDRTSASARAKDLNVSIGAGADAAFARALGVGQADRYPSAAEFAEALAEAFGDPAAAVAPPAVESPAAKPGGARKMTMTGMAAGGPSAQRAVPRPASAPAPAYPAAAPEPPQQPPPAAHATRRPVQPAMPEAPPPVQFAPPPAPPQPMPLQVAPVHAAHAAPAHAAQVAPAQTPPPAVAYAAPPDAVSSGDDEPINSIAGVPRRKGARVVFIAAITAVAFAVFAAIAWGAISLVMSLVRPAAKPVASAVAAPASAPAPQTRAPVVEAQPAPVASAPAPVAAPVVAAPPVESAAAAPPEKPPAAATAAAPKKPQSAAPPQPAPSPKPAAKPAPAKPAKKCGTFLKKC